MSQDQPDTPQSPASAGECGDQWCPEMDTAELQCRMLHGHQGAHQAYHRDRLYEWPWAT